MKCKIELKKRDVQLKDIPKFYEELIDNKVSVGVHKEQGQRLNPETKTPIINYALYNEFGTHHVTQHDYNFIRHGKQVFIKQGTDISISPRPFLRLYLFPENRNYIHKTYAESISNSFRGGLRPYRQQAKTVLEDVGSVGQILQWQNMDKWGIELPNAPLTIWLKGFNQPLYDTGALTKAIKYKISRKTGIV